MSISATRSYGRLFLLSGFYILLCVAGIFVAESQGWSESFWHTTQFFAVIICLYSSFRFLLLSRRDKLSGASVEKWKVTLAWFALSLTGLWLSFFAFVIFFLLDDWAEFD